MQQGEREALKAAIEHLYGVEALYQSDELVVVAAPGAPPLQRHVATFTLGPSTNRNSSAEGGPVAYAWTESRIGSHGPAVHHRVILGDRRVTSPLEAVRVALLLAPGYTVRDDR